MLKSHLAAATDDGYSRARAQLLVAVATSGLFVVVDYAVDKDEPILLGMQMQGVLHVVSYSDTTHSSYASESADDARATHSPSADTDQTYVKDLQIKRHPTGAVTFLV